MYFRASGLCRFRLHKWCEQLVNISRYVSWYNQYVRVLLRNLSGHVKIKLTVVIQFLKLYREMDIESVRCLVKCEFLWFSEVKACMMTCQSNEGMWKWISFRRACCFRHILKACGELCVIMIWFSCIVTPRINIQKYAF